MIEIDGSEGGGQMLRTALALSMLTLKPFRMRNIRKVRSEPGLKAQHLWCIRALEALSDSESANASVGSTEISFDPRKISKYSAEINIGTAGSITLVLQSLILPCLFSGKEVRCTIIGGTDVAWSPSIDYVRLVLLPHLQHQGNIRCNLLKRGYFPKGGGIVELIVNPSYDQTDIKRTLLPRIVRDDEGSLITVRGISHASKDLESARVADRQAIAAEHALQSLGVPVSIQREYVDSPCTGSGITLVAMRASRESDGIERPPLLIGRDALGSPGIPAEKVGSDSARSLIEELSSNAAVDRYMADQLVPFLAVFGGKIRTSAVTMHARTNMQVTELFLPSVFSVDKTTISVQR